MALKDNEMQVVSVLGTGVLVAVLFAPVLYFANTGAAKQPAENLVASEASIASRSVT